jgi:tRNA (guanine37-N1)-methyltransferase
MKVDVLTLFPGMFGGVFSESILRIARQKGRLDLRVWNIREYTTDRHRSVDDRPYGGGPGMVMKPEPVFEAVEHVRETRGEGRTILLTPQGPRFVQATARELAREEHLILVCGHYEGFDERIRRGLGAEKLSVGDFVLSGGEVAALLVTDAVARLLPDVLGHELSAVDESFSDGETIEYPQYTRPPEYRGMKVPEVLLSGNHEKIRAWREEQAESRTRQRRLKERSDEAT